MIGLLLRLENSHISNVWPRYPSFLALVQDGTIALMLETSAIPRSYEMLADIESCYLMDKNDSQMMR